MKKLWVSGFMVVVLYQLSMAQTINGVVKSEGNGQPIALANIGMLNSKMGTYTGDDGSFSLEFSQDFEGAVLVISAIGFEGKRISLKDVDITNELEIRLTSKNYELGEFTVEDSRIRTKTLGNPWLPLVTNRMAWSAGWSSTRIGKTIAIKIIIKHAPPIRLDEVSFGIYENPWEEALYRLRIMSIDSSGLPGEDVINLNKTSKITEKAGWVHFSFEVNAPILTVNEFFLVTENIENNRVFREPDAEGQGLFPVFMFNVATLSKQPVYLSNEGLQQWDKKPKDPTFRLKYAYE